MHYRGIQRPLGDRGFDANVLMQTFMLFLQNDQNIFFY